MTRKICFLLMLIVVVALSLGCAATRESKYLPKSTEDLLNVTYGYNVEPPSDFDIIAYGEKCDSREECFDYMPMILSNRGVRVPLIQIFYAVDGAANKYKNHKINVLFVAPGTPYIPAE